MNNLNQVPFPGQTQKNYWHLVMVAGAVLLVTAGLLLGGNSLIAARNDRNIATNARAESVSVLYSNPELKVLDYPSAPSVIAAQASEMVNVAISNATADLDANPELKVLGYPNLSDSAVRQLTSPEANSYAVPALSDRELRTNPELKMLNYPSVHSATAAQASETAIVVTSKTTADRYANPELKFLDSFNLSDSEVRQLTGPETYSVPIPAISEREMRTNPELKYLGNTSHSTP